MNYRELNLKIGADPITVFMQNGFFGAFDVMSPLHKHPYTEIQIAVFGEAEFSVEDSVYGVGQNEMIVIPPGQFHQRSTLHAGAKLISFQINKRIKACAVLSLPEGIGQQLLNEITSYMQCGKSAKIEFYLALICSALFEPFDPTVPIKDRAYLIAEFFSKNYNKDVTLHDLAVILELSEKQTERLILHYTGNTFRQELVHRRMEAARHLMKTEALSLAEIAEQVGYRSYSGFWKAYNKK